MILGPLRSVFLLDCIWSLPVSVCSWFCSSDCSFLLFPSPIAGIDGFSTYLGNEVNFSGLGQLLCLILITCFSDPSVICRVDNCVYKFEVADISADYSFSSSFGCDSGSIYLIHNVEYWIVWHAPTHSHLAEIFLVVCFCLLCSVSFSVCTLHLSDL